MTSHCRRLNSSRGLRRRLATRWPYVATGVQKSRGDLESEQMSEAVPPTRKSARQIPGSKKAVLTGLQQLHALIRIEINCSYGRGRIRAAVI